MSENKKPKLNTFVDRITAVMLDAGVDPKELQAKIAEICGIEVRSVSDWFNEPVKMPSPENVATLSVCFGADCVWLISGKYSSKESVCDRHNAEVFECNLESAVVRAENLAASGVTLTRNYKD